MDSTMKDETRKIPAGNRRRTAGKDLAGDCLAADVKHQTAAVAVDGSSLHSSLEHSCSPRMKAGRRLNQAWGTRRVAAAIRVAASALEPVAKRRRGKFLNPDSHLGV